VTRTLIGLVVGGVTAFAFGYVFGLALTPQPAASNDVTGLFLGILLCGNGMVAGSVVGAVGELTAVLRGFQQGHGSDGSQESSPVAVAAEPGAVADRPRDSYKASS
jgi:hypothetical protein